MRMCPMRPSPDLSESVWREHAAQANLSKEDRHAASEESRPCRQEGRRFDHPSLASRGAFR
jgi:hypothetical protein